MGTIGDRLRELRGSSSQAEMADAVGVKQQNWARWECDVVSPNAEMISKICRVHACSADWLLGISKSCNGRNFSVSATSGGIAIGGNVSGTVTTTRNPQLTTRNPPTCSKCQFKKKLQALEKVMKTV